MSLQATHGADLLYEDLLVLRERVRRTRYEWAAARRFRLRLQREESKALLWDFKREWVLRERERIAEEKLNQARQSFAEGLENYHRRLAEEHFPQLAAEIAGDDGTWFADSLTRAELLG